MGGCCYREPDNPGLPVSPKTHKDTRESLDSQRVYRRSTATPLMTRSSTNKQDATPSTKHESSPSRVSQSMLITALDRYDIPRKRLKKRIDLKYAIKGELIKGSSGVLYFGEHSMNHLHRIIRKVEIATGKSEGPPDIRQESVLATEVEILDKIDHPNVLKISEVLEDQDFVYVISEPIVGCVVLDFLEFIGMEKEKKKKKKSKIAMLEEEKIMNLVKQRNTIEEIIARKLVAKLDKERKAKMKKDKTEAQKAKEQEIIEERIRRREIGKTEVMLQLLHAIKYFHGKGIVHKNLSISNVILFETFTGHLHAKITGFGAVRGRPEENLNSVMSSILYAAPEALDESYTEKSDVWSCGVIGYLIFSQTVPFYGESKEEFRASLSRKLTFPDAIWSKHPPELVSLLRSMLEINPELRFSAAQCLEHSYFQLYLSARYVSITNIAAALANLKAFVCEQRLKMIILSFISMSVTSPEEKQPLINVFRTLDFNNDGVLTQDELLAAYNQSMSPYQAALTVSRVLENVDFDHSGHIDFSEFMVAASDHRSILTQKNLKIAYSLFDSDKSGDVSLEELKSTLKCKESEDQWEELMKQVDANKDGTLDFLEFCRLIKMAVHHASVRRNKSGEE